MPNSIPLWFNNDAMVKVPVEVATEEELLTYANKVREVGGADLLSALLPSDPNMSSSCLVARALNFECIITLHRRGPNNLPCLWASGAWKWKMSSVRVLVPSKKLADAGLGEAYGDSLVLPEPIGNAARAFDLGLAFTSYDQRTRPL